MNGDPHRRFTDLIGLFYDAALDETLWAGIAPQIAAAFDSTSTVLKLHGGETGVKLLESTANLVVPASMRSLAEYWHQHDLWVERSVAFGMSRVVTDEDLVSRAEQRRSGFYRDWLQRLDIHHMVGAVFPVGGEFVGVLGVHRPRAAGSYGEDDRRDVAGILPHLQRALLLRRRLSRATVAGSVALDALDQVGSGVLVVDRSRRIVHANTCAERMLRENSELEVANGRLTLRDSTGNSRLAAHVSAAIQPRHGASGRAVLAVARAGQPPMTLMFAPLRPHRSGRDGLPRLALVFLRDPMRIAIDPEHLRSRFGMTLTEAHVAIGLVRGQRVADIATARRIGLATVRSHLKRILAKTGARRQAEAAMLISRSLGDGGDT